MPKTKKSISKRDDMSLLREILKVQKEILKEILRLIKSSGTDAATVVLKKENVSFTKRENEVAKLVLKEYKNKEIAEALSISHKTVETHIHNIIKKLQVKTRVGIVRYADKNFLRRIAPKHWGFGAYVLS
ncbi:MAG: LuxR C-terminal-related transcriptional regulator [Nanoarchaeota archaeon]|nr:LuxR C-terminal-related transcriptional regulator [Nanoarchaeota archaeon]